MNLTCGESYQGPNESPHLNFFAQEKKIKQLFLVEKYSFNGFFAKKKVKRGHSGGAES